MSVKWLNSEISTNTQFVHNEKEAAVVALGNTYKCLGFEVSNVETLFVSGIIKSNERLGTLSAGQLD